MTRACRARSCGLYMKVRAVIVCAYLRQVTNRIPVSSMEMARTFECRRFVSDNTARQNIVPELFSQDRYLGLLREEIAEKGPCDNP